jgi:OsmC-like protein
MDGIYQVSKCRSRVVGSLAGAYRLASCLGWYAVRGAQRGWGWDLHRRGGGDLHRRQADGGAARGSGNLEKRRAPVESYRIELEGERAGEHPGRFTRILVRHVVSGEGITEKSLERVVSLSHEKYCSVAATLNSEIEAEAVLE